MELIRKRTLPPQIEILRPLNALMAGLGVFIGGVVAASTDILSQPILFRVFLAYIAAFTATGAGNTLNDIVDKETDKINHPMRPLPSGRLSYLMAMYIVIAGFGITIFLSLLINLLTFLVAMMNVILMVGYELYLKRKGLAGNLTISYLSGSVFLFGGVSTLENGSLSELVFSSATAVTSILALLAFLSSAGREIIKDIEDMEGDTDRQTLPKVIGKKNAGITAAILILCAVGLSWLPYYLHILGKVYLGIVIPADGMFIFSAIKGADCPVSAQKVAKLAMLLSLIAFFIGAIL